MEIRSIQTHLSVSPQISPQDLATLAAAGFKSIVCNRPDGESPEQTSHLDMAKACEPHGLVFHYLPAPGNAVTHEHGQQFGYLLDTLPKPILAYCRTGTRSTIMWALSQSSKQTPDEILEKAAQAGYDLSGIRSRLQNPS